MNQGGAIIERWTLLDDDPDEPGYPQAKITKRAQLRTAERSVCAALKEGGDAKPVVELEARCSRDRAWVEASARDRNVCDRTTWPRASAKRGLRK